MNGILPTQSKPYYNQFNENNGKSKPKGTGNFANSGNLKRGHVQGTQGQCPQKTDQETYAPNMYAFFQNNVN